MRLIVGLGNPGREYQETKHNVGFRVIEKLAEEHGIRVEKLAFRAFLGEGHIKGEKVFLLKPQTYMNLSGESVREMMRFYKIPLDALIVVFDDTSLPLGALRIREKGSAGGHNGVKNIIKELGSDSFCRVKVGIGEKPNGWDLADYVLSKFTKDEQPLIEAGIERAVQAVELLLSEGLAPAMNQMNQRKGV